MTDTPLPNYSADRAVCGKCNARDADVSYQRGIPVIHAGNGDVNLMSRLADARECLLRTCQRCGWAWLEATADAEPAGPPPAARLRPCPACTASMAACITKGGRCCTMCHHAPAHDPVLARVADILDPPDAWTQEPGRDASA